MRKNILLVIPALNAGGAERVMVTLANEWVKDNNVSLVIFHNTPSFYELNKKVNFIQMGLTLPLNKLYRLISIPIIEIKRFLYIYNLILNGHYDFILSFTNITNIFVSIISMIRKNEYIIVSERADPEKYSKLIKYIIDWLYRKNKMVICQNSVVKKYFMNKGFKNKLVVLPNPVSFDDIPNVRAKNRNKVITTVGRLTSQKNQKLLISAFSEVRKIHSEYSLKIYGTGPLENELHEQISKLGLNNYVQLMGTKKKVMYEIDKSEIFVLCSNYEGFPNVLIEAMATQMPVISSDFGTGVARDLITDGENGYIFSVGDLDGLIMKLKSLIERQSDFLEIGKMNRKIALEYKSDKVSKSWLETILKNT